MFNPRAGEPQDSQGSYDLGWMLENSQVSEEEFCTFLLEQISPEIERLAARFFKSPADRITAVDQILLKVLLKRARYKSTISGKIWLYKIMLDASLERLPLDPFHLNGLFPRVLKGMDAQLDKGAHFHQFLDSLTARQRLFAVFYYGQNLAVEDIAVVLKTDVEVVRSDCKQTGLLLLAHQHTCQECSALPGSLSSLEAALREELQAPHLLMETARTDGADWARSLQKRYAHEKMSRQTRKWAGHALESGCIALFVILGIWTTTHPGQIPAWFSKPGQTSARVQVSSAATPPGPAPTATPGPPSYALHNQDAENVLNLARTSWARWTSLWADVQVKAYFPETFIPGAGNPSWRSERKQIWLSLPGSSRVISGARQDIPDLTYSIISGRLSEQDFESGEVSQTPAAGLIPDSDLQRLFSPLDMFNPGGQFIQKGADVISGRPTWVLDWDSGGETVLRFWIDQQYGVILRRLEFGQGLNQPVLSDIQVTRIFFDADFPSALFEPFRYKGNFYTSDFAGNPDVVDLQTSQVTSVNLAPGVHKAIGVSPSQRDLAAAHLSLLDVPAGWMQFPDGPGLAVFADQFDLGKLPMGGKTVLACERSPDGKWIAYDSPPQGSSKSTYLMLAELSSLHSGQPVLPAGITSGDFAFSPDNKKLAFFGCEKASGYCGIFILDIPSGKLTRPAPLTFAETIDWSPDGRTLALVGSIDTSQNSHKLASANLLMNDLIALANIWFFEVIDPVTGDITFQQPYRWSDMSPPPSSPTYSWTKPFGTPKPGFNACVNPPSAGN